jgi:hypothetical protein
MLKKPDKSDGSPPIAPAPNPPPRFSRPAQQPPSHLTQFTHLSKKGAEGQKKTPGMSPPPLRIINLLVHSTLSSSDGDWIDRCALARIFKPSHHLMVGLCHTKGQPADREADRSPGFDHFVILAISSHNESTRATGEGTETEEFTGMPPWRTGGRRDGMGGWRSAVKPHEERVA